MQLPIWTSSTSKICDMEVFGTVETDRNCEYTEMRSPVGCCYREISSAEVTEILRKTFGKLARHTEMSYRSCRRGFKTLQTFSIQSASYLASDWRNDTITMGGGSQSFRETLVYYQSYFSYRRPGCRLYDLSDYVCVADGKPCTVRETPLRPVNIGLILGPFSSKTSLTQSSTVT